MRKLVVLITLCSFVSMGCASSGNYVKYLDAKRHQAEAERKPLFELGLTDEGKVASLVVYPQPQRIDIQQEKDHPGYALAGGVVRILGIVGSIFVAGEAITDIVSASTGDSSYINSANDNSGNTGSLDQGYDITTDNSATTPTETTE